jgi:hypothetical protein
MQNTRHGMTLTHCHMRRQAQSHNMSSLTSYTRRYIIPDGQTTTLEIQLRIAKTTNQQASFVGLAQKVFLCSGVHVGKSLDFRHSFTEYGSTKVKFSIRSLSFTRACALRNSTPLSITRYTACPLRRDEANWKTASSSLCYYIHYRLQKQNPTSLLPYGWLQFYSIELHVNWDLFTVDTVECSWTMGLVDCVALSTRQYPPSRGWEERTTSLVSWTL